MHLPDRYLIAVNHRQ